MTTEELVRTRLKIDPRRIAEFCQRWRIRELSLFGSAVGDDFGPESDVDLLVVFEDPHRDFGPWASELVEMKSELQALFGRKVDLVIRKSVTNPFIRHSILSSRRVIYAA